MSMPTTEEFRAEILKALPSATILEFRYPTNGRHLGITAVLGRCAGSTRTQGVIRPLKYIRWSRGYYHMGNGSGLTVAEAVAAQRRWLVHDGKSSAVFWLDQLKSTPR